MFTIVCDKTNADSFRWSQTVADHMETSLYCQKLESSSFIFYFILAAGVSDHSLVPAIANLQLTKQDDRKDSQHTIDSESSETDSCYGDDRSYEASSSKRENSEDAVTEDQSKAPVELKGEVLILNH